MRRAMGRGGVLLLLIASVLALAAAVGATPAELLSFPEDIRLWNYSLPEIKVSGSTVLQVDRWWDRTFLQRAGGLAHYEQLFPLIRKLRRGEPIVIIGLGSSVMASHAGCFHDTREQLARRLNVRAINTTEDVDRVVPTTCNRNGYMGLFMRFLNKTFPHEGEAASRLPRGKSHWRPWAAGGATLPLAAHRRPRVL